MNNQHLSVMISKNLLDGALIILRTQHIARPAHWVAKVAVNELDWAVFTEVLVQHKISS